MVIIKSWKKLIEQYESGNKVFETEVLNSNYSIADYNYFTIETIVKFIQDKYKKLIKDYV